VRGYDLSSGSELWFSKGFNGRGSPIPFFGDGLLYVVNGKPGDLYAVKPALGDGQKSKMIWNAKRNGGRDLPSPAMLESMVFVTSMGGVITCYDAPTGKTLWIDRLEGAFSGSPLVSKSHYYIQNESGVTFVIEPDRKHLKVIARNRLSQSQEEIFRSTLSPISGKLYTRSLDQLYCFAGN
jgi:outer membrane protein assembly factor BamB